MANDWTRSETISPPDRVVVKYVGKDQQGKSVEREVILLSSTRSTSESTYQAIAYKDKDGKPQSSEVVVRKVDTRWTTIASVNQYYVGWRLSNELDLPDGGAKSENITTSEYTTTVDGPVLVKETTENYDSMAQFAGGLQIVDYKTFRPSGTEMILTQRTIREIKQLKSANGREVTQTKTSRWMARGVNKEGSTDFAIIYQKYRPFIAIVPQLVQILVRAFVDLVFEGTEVQIETGRIPVPEKPSDQAIAANEVTDGSSKTPSDATPKDKYGNNKGWTAFVPGGSKGPVASPDQSTDWKEYAKDSNGNGQPDWKEYVPQTWEDHNQDSNNDGVPDWADYVPPEQGGPSNWEEFNTDTNNDGTPDWADFVPTGDEFDTKDSDYTTTETEVSNDKTLTGVVLFDGNSYNNPASTVSATYDMPFAPDDYFEYVKGIRQLVRGGATQAAEAFGRTEAALDIGHAYGQNIVTGWNETPTLDLSAIYIRLAGIEGAFLMDSTSYAWGPDGMVVSSDLMLLGVAGWYGTSAPATSWLRLPVPVAGLQQVSAGTAGTANKANSVTLPGNFNPRNPGALLASLPSTGTDSFALYRSQQGVIAPTLELERFSLAVGPLLIVQEFPYALTTVEVVTLATGPVIAIPPSIPLAGIVYSQSSVYSSNTAATVANMQNDQIGGGATGTSNGALEWIAMDLGAVYVIDRVVIGTATEDMPGGWTKAASEDRDIQYSINGTTWIVGGNTGTFAAEGVYEITVSFSARYIRIVAVNDYLGLSELYPLTIEQIKTVDAALFTGPYFSGTVFSTGDPSIVSGTAAPVLGAAQVSPSTNATNAGWTLEFDGTSDENSTELTGFGFNFTLNSVAYTGCFVASNSYITFGSSSLVYENLGAAVPAVPKLHIGSNDFSYQRVYAKAETNLFRVRWEGNSSYSASIGSSNRFLEVTFYKPLSDGTQLLEVRTGNISGATGGPFMLATASTALATGTFAANQSWVFSGNAAGTSWTLQAGAHVEGPET